MSKSPHSAENHYIHRTNWLRAAVLGANDGIVSTGSLIVGVAASSAGRESLLIAGVAGLVAGSMSMAAGEYVSVSSQADTERADLQKEREALAEHPQAEHEELAQIYTSRGVELDLARQVAGQLMAKDALAAHARDELGISSALRARPMQAASISGGSFALGAALPLVSVALAPFEHSIPVVSIASLASLALLGAGSAQAGGAGRIRAIARVTGWGALAMAATAAIGAAFGALM